jgi:hypothetical protein
MTMALSYSRLSDYRQCPNKFKLKYITKAKNFIEDPNKSIHLVRGGNVHKGLENYVIKKRAGEVGIPASSLAEVESTKPLIDSLMTIYDVHPELQVAIDVNWQVVDWFSKDAWFRVIYDLIGFGRNLFLGDYKTGKFKDYTGSMDEPGQLHLSSLVAMAVWEQFEEVDNRYIYVDHKKTIDLKLTRTEHFETLKQSLIREHAEVNAETIWAPTKNEFCNFCQATLDQCIHAKRTTLPGMRR